ncbi:MAG: hypothetical protein QOE60_1360 [Thermoleophilaceae bacterium]|nr:hypothetical protein [Thermoleophilaceae bacterium]
MDTALPWPEITEQWREREFSLLRQAVARIGDVPFGRLDDLLDPAEESQTRPEDPAVVVREAFAAVGASPGGPALLATYLYGKCLDKWERSEEYDVIEAVLRPLREEALRGAAGDHVLALVAEHALSTIDAMAVESGLNCSCPIYMQERAAEIVKRTNSMLDGSNGRELAQPVGLLRADAETQKVYFGAVRDTAAAVLAFLMREEPGPGNFDTVIDDLLEAEGDPAVHGDVFESELRAHRVTLSALQEAAPKPRLAIDSAEIVYIYPFALRGKGDEPDTVIRRALDEGEGWELGPNRIKPGRPLPLEVTSVWERPGSDEPKHGGAALPLPDLSVTPTADVAFSPETGGDYTFDCQAELRLSRLGNHYLRVRSRPAAMDLHDLNQALRRASRSMGEETIRSGAGEWSKFVDYAEEIIDGLTACLSTSEAIVTSVGDPTADFHVVVGARSLSIRRADGTKSPAAVADLAGAVGGSLLLHPVRDLATSLEEWVRYPPPVVENLMEGAGYIDDMTVRTPNTTVIYMPSSPDWSFQGYEEMVEFIAAVPPLLASWEDQIIDFERAVKDELPELRREAREPHPDDAAEEYGPRNPRRLDEILEREAALRELETYVRQELARLHSRRLVRNRVHREFLDRLWEAAGLPRLEAELERQLDVIATLNERLSTLESSIAERNRQKSARYLELVLGVIGVISLTGLFSWVNGEFGIGSDVVAAGETVVLVLMGAIVAAIILRQRR